MRKKANSYNSNKLNIAMLGHKRIPSREGGIEIVVEELATRMVEQGHKVTCYNRSGNHVSGITYGSFARVKEYKGINLKSVFTIDKKGLAAMTSSLSASIRVTIGRYDVIHYHAEGPCAMMWITKLFGKKCVATIHGLDWQRAKWKSGFGSKYIKFGEKMAVKYADEIIVLSKNVQEYFQNTYKRETVLIPNGVNRPEIADARDITSQYGITKDSYFLYLGRIVPEKGVKYLVEAFQNVKTDKKLVIAGGSSDTDEFMSELKEIAKVDERIIFTGFVQGRILEELYSNAYVYVLPSDLEGMPLSLLEAMSYGNCVLGSDIEEIAEVVEDKAVLHKKSNVVDLGEKLQELADDERLVHGYKERACDYICERYSWEDVVSQTVEVY